MTINGNSTFRDDGYRAAFSCKPAHGPGRAMPVLQQEYEDGYAEGAADRSLLTSLKSAVLEALDGDSIKAFGSFEAFKESLDVSNHYQYEDAADDQPSDRSAEFLPLAYEELCASEIQNPLRPDERIQLNELIDEIQVLYTEIQVDNFFALLSKYLDKIECANERDLFVQAVNDRFVPQTLQSSEAPKRKGPSMSV